MCRGGPLIEGPKVGEDTVPTLGSVYGPRRLGPPETFVRHGSDVTPFKLRRLRHPLLDGPSSLPLYSKVLVLKLRRTKRT